MSNLVRLSSFRAFRWFLVPLNEGIELVRVRLHGPAEHAVTRREGGEGFHLTHGDCLVDVEVEELVDSLEEVVFGDGNEPEVEVD